MGRLQLVSHRQVAGGAGVTARFPMTGTDGFRPCATSPETCARRSVEPSDIAIAARSGRRVRRRPGDGRRG